MSIRFRFDATRVEPLLQRLASIRRAVDVEDALVSHLSSWPGIFMVRMWPPGTLHTPLGLAKLRQVSSRGTAIHIRESLAASDLAPPHSPDLVGLGTHPLGSEPPHGVLLVLTTVPLEEDSFWWLGRVAEHATIALERETSPNPSTHPILTATGLRALEKENLVRALAASKGKIFGAGGAAELLEMKPTTLASRLQALGIPRKPASPKRSARSGRHTRTP